MEKLTEISWFQLGGKRLGLGAQKVRTNFADIEKEAELADKIKFNEPEKTEVVEKSNEDQEIQVWMINLILLYVHFFQTVAK